MTRHVEDSVITDNLPFAGESELSRLRAKVEELKGILREAPSALDEAGMEGNCEARGDTDGAELHRTNVKRWLTKVQAAVSSYEQAKP